MKYILVINSGSVTLKFKVFEFDSLREVIGGIVERIGLSGSFIEVKSKNTTDKKNCKVKNHEEALKIVLDQFSKFQIPDSGFSIIGHRVVHGGEEFIRPTVVTPAVLRKMKKYSKLAPLHNPANLMGIAACQKFLLKAKNIAVFDTSFYASLPDYVYTYALPYEFYLKHGIRRYGFHGISHYYVATEVAKKLKGL